MSPETRPVTDLQQTLYEDDAHYLKSRGVISICGKSAPDALQPLITNSLESIRERSILAYILTENDKIFADMFIISHDEGLLLDCSRSQLPAILDLLNPRCKKLGATVTDVSDQWRVFCVLPSQSIFMDGTTCIKYSDPRNYMGTRVLRSRSDAESSEWIHENNWVAHCFRLGYLPSADLLKSQSVCPMEANLHILDVLHSDCLNYKLKKLLEGSRDQIVRRVLPMRVEPITESFPTLTGLSIVAGGEDIATVLGHLGVYGLALTDLTKWRTALASSQQSMCAKQTVSLNWPTWCATEGKGRGGPVAFKKE